MMYTIAAVLFVLWVAGMVSSYTMAGVFHVLLVIAVAIALLRFVGAHRPR